jgi:hypothetical protein
MEAQPTTEEDRIISVTEAGSPFWVYVVDPPRPDAARFHRWDATDYATGAEVRRAWGLRSFLSTGAGPAEVAPGVFPPQLFRVSTGACIVDEESLPAQGVRAGDVLLLLPDASPGLLNYVRTVAGAFPGNLPPDLSITGRPAVLADVEALLEARQRSRGGVSISGGTVNIWGVVANTIENSRITVKNCIS